MTVFEMYEKRPRNLWIYLLTSAIVISLVCWSATGLEFKEITQ